MLQLKGHKQESKFHSLFNIRAWVKNHTAGDGESEGRILTLAEQEQRGLELQFAGSIISFNCITVDTDNCLGQGILFTLYRNRVKKCVD